METERKFLPEKVPDNLASYPFSDIEQAYIHDDPVIRIRKRDEKYFLTVKNKGLLSREEFETEISKKAYDALLPKVSSRIIRKKRYFIPLGKSTVELDVFTGSLEGLLIAEVEFPRESDAHNFVPPIWLGKEVTYDKMYQNVNLAYGKEPTLPPRVSRHPQ